MCVRVICVSGSDAQLLELAAARLFWQPATRTIYVPGGLNKATTLIAVRAVLEELLVEQPPSGAVCYCGQPVDVDAALRASANSMIHR